MRKSPAKLADRELVESMLRHGGGTSVTVAVPVFVASAWLVAVMVTVCTVVKLAGAV